MKLRIALAAAAAGLAAASIASAETAVATVSANIVAPAALTKTRDLDFGTIAKPFSGSSTVTLASALNPTATPTVTGSAFVPTPGQARAAVFHLIGTNGQSYTISPPTLTFTGAGSDLTSVGAEAPVADSGRSLASPSLPASGTDDLYIGGHFTMSDTTTVKSYTGTLTLTVSFN